MSRQPKNQLDFVSENSSDNTITRRCWLPIDIDPLRPSGVSATVEERRLALDVINDLCEKLEELGFTTNMYGASVAKVALAEGANSHQVFDWRRAYLKGKLDPKGEKSAALLPVVLSPADASAVAVDAAAFTEKSSIRPIAAMPGGAIHIELPGRVKIRVESGVDAALLRGVLQSLRP